MREKAAEQSARLCADAEAETTATDVPSVAEATQPVSLGDAGAGHEDTHVFTEYELGVSYSPDTEEGSVSTVIESKPPAKRGMDDATRRSICVVSVLLLTPLRNEVPGLLSARRRRAGPQCLASRSREEGMDAS
uniref:Uncharacterized protein n=1 Tax=Peronospora matthiolae TaxID=2874970 RepID=A0AAV1TEZ7_9STRA